MIEKTRTILVTGASSEIGLAIATQLHKQPQLLSLVLKVILRAICTFLIKQTGLKVSEAKTGAVTLIQRFGSIA